MLSKKLFPLKKTSSFELKIPSDKSIAHRAFILAAFAQEKSRIEVSEIGEDLQATLECIQCLGAGLQFNKNYISITPIQSMPIKASLNCKNSGTTMRLLTGILCGYEGEWIFHGDASLNSRPMGRLEDALKACGVRFKFQNPKSRTAPFTLDAPKKINNFNYELPIASAQIKSACLFAAMKAQGLSQFSGKIQSRNHSEEILQKLNAPIKISDEKISIKGPFKIKSINMHVPSDLSSFAFWAAFGGLFSEELQTFKKISLNKSRLTFLEKIKSMGCFIEYHNEEEALENYGDIHLKKATSLKAIDIHEEESAFLIDEIPLLALLCTQAEGVSHFRGLRELKHKESDRFKNTLQILRAFGASIEELPNDSLKITGPSELTSPQKMDSDGDHRMAFLITLCSWLVKDSATELINHKVTSVSYPNFWQDIKNLEKKGALTFYE